jgi:hypothetical protein
LQLLEQVKELRKMLQRLWVADILSFGQVPLMLYVPVQVRGHLKK